MSGGHFDYHQYRVREIAEEIERLIANNGKLDRDGWGHDYPPEIIERFKEAAHTLERAADMAQRVDWLVSGDDGPESFMKRWDAEVRDPWIEVDDTNPASVPETFGHFLVATDSGLVTESFYVPDLKYFDGRPVPSRKWNGKYSRRFEAAQHGYKITHWMPLPAHPKTNNQQPTTNNHI